MVTRQQSRRESTAQGSEPDELEGEISHGDEEGHEEDVVGVTLISPPVTAPAPPSRCGHQAFLGVFTLCFCFVQWFWGLLK